MSQRLSLPPLSARATAELREHQTGWGLVIEGPGRATLEQPFPFQAEVRDEGGLHALSAAYGEVKADAEGISATARIQVSPDVALTALDRWSVQGGALHLERRVRVQGHEAGSFLTAITLRPRQALGWPDVDAFAPGMLYGFGEGVAQHAIGSVAHYLDGVQQVRIREDRLPAPLFGVSFRDGTSLTVANPAPAGHTTRADSLDLEGDPLVDARFAFTALGVQEHSGGSQGRTLDIGLWFPGSEGEVTYLAATPFVGGEFGNNVRRRWRERHHPLQDGLEQRYRAAFRLGEHERPQDFRRNAWRWAWSLLEPQLEPQPIGVARSVISQMLEDSVRQVEDRAGPAHVLDAVTGHDPGRHPVLMGFTGRAVESAELLLQEAERLDGERKERRRERALAVLETFARLPMSPPQAEGVHLADGRLTSGVRPNFYLRALGEGGKYMLRAYARELGRGHDHPHWLRWCVTLADWLLGQERPEGGFPRAWQDGSARVVMDDVRSSNAVVPFFVTLSAQTGDGRYLRAARRASERCWVLDGQRGTFVGGTLDNANVVDKEAGTLALEAHLALLDATGDGVWLERAKSAADFAETWIYLWSVPMPDDEDAQKLHWKPGVSTVGAQLIATGHSLTDAYMAWDVASYARLWQLTGDEHYLEVARLLLHNTKTMLALPGRTFDLLGPGWQQEHWSFAPPRGYGIHREWLPWVAASHLEGISALEALNEELFEALSGQPGEARLSGS